MELLQEILCNLFAKEEIRISFPNFAAQNVERIVEMECYRALTEIRRILDDDSLEDSDCFKRIEEIVCLFEAIGSSGGSRHDFG